jgi:hypothetical protein
MTNVLHEIRHAIRTLRRARGVTGVSLLVLGIGIGVNAAIISVADDALRRPLPYPDAARLVRLEGVFTRLPLRMTETGLELAYLSLLKTPFLLLPLMLRPIVDTLLGDDVRAPLAPSDPTRIGAFARSAPA